VTNIACDLSDSIALLYVFSSIDGKLFPKEHIESLEFDENQAVDTKLVTDLQKLGISGLLGDQHLRKCNKKVNVLLCTLIILINHGLENKPLK
jgi:phage replication-related protein YjqB (UPF0714/DUF867 family)